ncbi:MAG: polysaccharide deacetylase family protein [Clostridiales bacterium]|nr:polysaccharide deacetylase family protein [Clostridiales bacterium]
MRKFIFLIFVLLSCVTVYAGESWGVYFPKNGGRPETNATAEHLAQFDTYFVGNENEKVLYMTFDAGYDNGYTARILDTLKKHEVRAAFFLVGTYIRDYPELTKRMVDEGHIVANHTMSHPDMSKISDFDSFAKELSRVEELYKELIGKDIPKFYRPPRGIYSETNLKHAKQLGYTTVFWTTAYKDWEVNNQPSKEEAFSKLMPRTHPGSVILLHNVSKTNADIMDELLTRYKELGYTFKDIYHLTGK